MNSPKSLMSVEWLKANLDNPDIIIVDATVHLPDTGRVAKEEYECEHIPGAVFFDLDVISDPDNPRPRKIPPLSRFIQKVGELGISNGKHVIAYDTRGLYSAARVWWLFRHYGYDNVSVLDGGMVAWEKAGGPVEAGFAEREPAEFKLDSDRGLLALKEDVLAVSKSGGQILDARTPGRWAGTENDRYPGARAGRIPGSANLYWEDLLEKDDRTFVSNEILNQKFEATGISMNEPVTISCGSGLTACILALGLSNIGKDDWRVYDGSWDEWGRGHELPIASDV